MVRRKQPILKWDDRTAVSLPTPTAVIPSNGRNLLSQPTVDVCIESFRFQITPTGLASV
jgi:hypothetical protein